MVALSVILSLSGFLLACEKKQEPAGADAPVEASADAAAHEEAGDEQKNSAASGKTDGAPRLQEVASEALPKHPDRVVSLAPNLTEIIYLVQADQRLVGVTRFDDYPPEVKEKAKVGGLIDVDFEALLNLRPDLVVGTNQGADQDFVAKLDRAEIPYLFIQMNTLDEIYAGIERVSEALAQPERGAEISAKMRADVEQVSASGAAQAERPSVLLVFGHEPLVAAGPGAFGHELLELAGAENVLKDADNPYPVLDIEKVLSLNPDYIIDTTLAGGDEGLKPADREFWAPYDALDAVKNERVVYFEDSELLRPAPRLVQGLEQLQAVIGVK